MKKILLLLCLCLPFWISAQNQPCSSDAFQRYLMQQADINQKTGQINQQLADYIQQNPNPLRGGNPLIVPVVFHVIHQNGPENVSDSVLIAEIAALNQYFSNSGSFYDPTGVNVNIQFCLASVDPYGNPTNGITRNYSPYAVVDMISSPINDLYMKNVNRWNPFRYLNIWIVKEVLGYANAYASLPGALGNDVDGVVITGPSLGMPHYLITHEVGHYLGLNHHFVTGNCLNFNCLLDGDNICDTPPELPNNYDCTVSTCSTETDDTTGLSPFVSDVPDLSTIMTPRINCPWIFTQGQADRMYASLSQIRTQLLSSNACGGNNPGTIPVASFVLTEFGCNAIAMDYTGTAYEYLEWDTNNDGIPESTQNSYSFQPNQSGNYTIVVRAFGSAGADVDTQVIYLHARPTTIYPLQSIQGAVPGGLCRGTPLTLTAVPGMSSYHWSTGDTTQSITIIPDTSFYLTLTCIDSTGYVWQRCPDTTVYYPVFPAVVTPPIYSLSGDSLCFSDTLIFTANLLPGQTRIWWIMNGFINQSPMDTMYIYHPFTANNQISMLIQDTNYCQAYLDTVIFYTDPTVPQPYQPYYWNYTLYGHGGNSWHHQFYLNGVPIPGADSSAYEITQPGCYSVYTYNQYPHCGSMSDTVCIWLVGGEKLVKGKNFVLYPNPSTEQLNIDFDEQVEENNISLGIINLLGEKVEAKIIRQNRSSLQVDISNLAPGLYHLDLNGITKKFVKQSP